MIEAITISIRTGLKYPGDIYTNPADAQVLADTGQLQAGNYLFSFILHATVAAIVDIQHRNVANDGNVDTPVRVSVAANSNEYPFYPSKINIVANQRVRIVLSGGITGNVQASIFSLPVA